MKPDPRFLKQPKHFWANVRSISQHLGYTDRKSHQVKVPDLSQVQTALIEIGLSASHVVGQDGQANNFGKMLLAYFVHRAQCLNEYVKPRLMPVARAKREFETLRAKLSPKCAIPMNKQKGPKKAPAYFTGIINMLIEANSKGLPCDYSPRELTTVTRDGAPLRTLARWVDGAFPSAVNPIAVWEIKEYYYTTTFGSRVADGVYETLLDGLELEELRQEEGIDVRHYLMVDAYETWWEDGRSYLCRIVDMLHMGYVDEVLFGSEVLERMPGIVKEWAEIVKRTAKK